MSHYETLKDSLMLRQYMKSECCDECYADSYRGQGHCKRCLQNIADNNEWIDTNLFIFDTNFRCYHADAHRAFKAAKLRMPDEKPRLYYGLEVEVEFDEGVVSICDARNGYDGAAEYVRETLNQFSIITGGLFCYEEDGSLDNGIEFISRPCSYKFWTDPSTVKRLKDGFDYLVERGALEEQPCRNGLHIHISKAFFTAPATPDKKKQVAEECYKSFDWLFQYYQKQMEFIGERKYGEYCGSKTDKIRQALRADSVYVGGYASFETETKVRLKKGGMPACGDHGFAVNSTDRTIEARIFKSTVWVDRMLAYIEIMRNFSHYVREGQASDTLDGILHTKENKYLDRLLAMTAMNVARAGKKFELDKEIKDELEFKVTSSRNQ